VPPPAIAAAAMALLIALVSNVTPSPFAPNFRTLKAWPGPVAFDSVVALAEYPPKTPVAAAPAPAILRKLLLDPAASDFIIATLRMTDPREGHLLYESGKITSGRISSWIYGLLRARKNSCNNSAHCPANTPPRTLI
jgi:hypothetical protein